MALIRCFIKTGHGAFQSSEVGILQQNIVQVEQNTRHNFVHTVPSVMEHDAKTVQSTKRVINKPWVFKLFKPTVTSPLTTTS